MSRRATIFGGGAPGGQVEYAGDLTPPVRTYAAGTYAGEIGRRLRIPASTNMTNSAVVSRQPRRGGIRCFYSYGPIPMPDALPYPGAAGVGEINRSSYQPYNSVLFDWHINPSWYEAGYPRNLGLSTRVSQLQTNQTGAPGRSQMVQRPLFTRVQTVPRARVQVRTYPTRGTVS